MDRSIIGNLRLFSGLILFIFVLGHFINHALGIISLRAMNDWLWLFIQPWREPVGEIILLLALIIHVFLALYSLYKRKSINMSWQDASQLVSGFLIPILLAGHIAGTRGLHEAFGVVEGYEFTLYSLWVAAPGEGITNAIALVLVWFHACLGWHMWLRLKPWYNKLKLWLLGLAIVIPTLALAGYLSAGLRVSRLSRSENWVARIFKRTADRVEEFLQFVETSEMFVVTAVLLSVGLVLLLRITQTMRSSKRGGASITYRDFNLSREEQLSITPGSNVLDLVRAANIPHAAVCGGRGRCSTCRVRIDAGETNVSNASSHEQMVLNRISAPANVRLACQLIPEGEVSVTALLKPETTVRDVLVPTRNSGGEEQPVAILFADIRAFTKLSEDRLPYDTAFLLNRYFAAMGEAIEQSGGHLDKFIGDGVMAIFGIDKGLEEGCREALLAAANMSQRLIDLNKSLEHELKEPLRIGIGIHSGTAIVGNMGYNRATGLTAIGDVVNTASRLETLTKEFSSQLIVSKTTVDSAGIKEPKFDLHSTPIRGREAPLEIFAVESASIIQTTIEANKLAKNRTE